MASDNYPPEFTIACLVHGDIPLLEKTIPTTIEALTAESNHTWDTVLIVDGVESAAADQLLELGHRFGFDEIRLRNRMRHVSPGDPSNNGHAHMLPGKGRYLISFEGDVVAFRTGPGDVLDIISSVFEMCPNLALATRIDDHDCWQWPLHEVGPPLTQDVRSVNRVSSHFLIYDLPRATREIWMAGGVAANEYHDDGKCWYNYEDWLSKQFAAPKGSGIGFIDNLPIKVFHCDEKIAHESALYRRDLRVRLQVFENRKKQCENLIEKTFT
ncbi:MAG: hypothetical protein P8179_14675 [Candidatus Thiodiazotropha sp.]|jgi:hypothetical protein